MDNAPSLLPPQLEGRLLPRFFLDTGLPDTAEWAALPDSEVDAFAARLAPLFAGIATHAAPNEAETEATLIFPVLDALGWHHLPQQAANARREDRPDALLFADPAARDAARRQPPGSPGRMRTATIVQENKAWGLRLDSAGPHATARTPASQMLRYLRLAEETSEGSVRWGLLTNGRLWRLYHAGAGSRAEQYLEADLAQFLDAQDAGLRRTALRGFLLFFRPGAHRPAGDAPLSFLDTALAAGRRYETRITATLSKRVFDQVFPDLVAAITAADRLAIPADPAWRAAAGEAAMILLYRCLFVLYAEDRRLLPVDHPGYQPYAFRGLREDAAKAADDQLAVSPRGTVWWSRMTTLFRAIAEGDKALGLPPYNGGLFDDTDRPILARIQLRDASLAALIEALSREGPAFARHWINYRDLSVQQLGAIYEGLLEREVAADPAGPGGVATRPNAYARKTTGSYYTPEALVQLVIRRAVRPLLRERVAAFRQRADELAADRGPKAERVARLAALDPAEAFLKLRVCDPAMGSGHFLVSLVDHLADATLEAMEEAAEAVTWADYASPLAAALAIMRRTIRDRATAGGWVLPEHRLDDKALVRRIILKRVVHGVDLNPMAVELAKLSLWLHSFTVGAPLSFLDHHLRCGDALFGEFVGPLVLSRTATLAVTPSILAARNAAHGMARIEQIADADLSEVHESMATFETVEEATAPVRGFLDVVQAARWLDPPKGDPERDAYRDLLLGAFGDPVAVASGAVAPAGRGANAAASLLARTRALAAERRFLHWELAFPNVWDRWEGTEPEGGFDAVIGNPPWDRLKLQEVEWFAARVPEIAHASRAADRKRHLAALRAAGGEMAEAYGRAAWAAEAAGRVARADARAGGPYPLLSGGDVNLYSLFVERALRLVRRDGMVGLLVPSGIAADKGAAPFFRSISTTGRLDAFLDFENRRTTLNLDPFFPDVDTRFKFAVLAVGGTRRRFEIAALAFFQQDAAAAEAASIALAPEDFSTLNPNTGTAPVFRTQRDAEITLAVHRRLPVLVRQGPQPRAVWPLRYLRMFDMTNDSDKFVTTAELQRDGAYRVAANRWKQGEAEWVPLLVGRSIHQFDHRFAAVVENAENLHNPFGGQATTPAEHTDPAHVPPPRFWIAAGDVELPAGLQWAIGFRDIARPTDARTMIAAIVPFAGCGNTLPLLLPRPPRGPALPTPESHARWRERERRSLLAYAAWAPLLLGNLNALAFDYVARQKVQSTHLNSYILEQLPVVPRAGYGRLVGGQPARRLVRDHVLRLTYTANDLAPFARSQGHAGPPFRWDEEERLHLSARLDALFFLLYGLDRDAAGHILTTFPIVEREERARFRGAFRSRDLILGYLAAFAAGDTESRIAA